LTASLIKNYKGELSKLAVRACVRACGHAFGRACIYTCVPTDRRQRHRYSRPSSAGKL